MNKKLKTIIGIIVFLLILTGALTISLFTGRIAMNPDGTVGNTAGNLNNGGLFCEYDGTVYFANSYAGGVMYAMNPDESDIRRLNNTKCRNILAGGKYLYYFQLAVTGETGIGAVRNVHSFNRCDLRGDHNTGLLREVVVTGQLVNNHLYLLTAGEKYPSLYKIKIDKSEKEELAKYIINPACAVNGTIYYNGTQDDHYLYALDTSTDSSRVVWEGNLWYPVVDGDYVYYMDVAENYRLCRYSMSQNVIEVLTQDRVDCFNVGNGYIYYQKNSETEPQLKYIRTDGSEPTVIAEGIYTNINMTSRYVYFQSWGNDTTMYHSMLGSTQYSSFDAASQAVLAGND